MSSITRFFIFAVMVFSTLVVSAQNTPRDLSDLVGERASNGENELRNRGFRYIKTSKGGGGSYTNWWRSSDNTCITVLTSDGRYSSIVKVVSEDCNRSSNNTWNSGGRWGNSGGWSNSSGRQVSPPSWARGSFYGRGPRGENIQLTINSNGSVVSYVNGGQNYGSFIGGDTISINGASARVTRNGNGITTTRTDNGERISYSRNPSQGGNDHNNSWGGGNWGNEQVSPPSWARGNFYGTGPRGERITLTINSNGSLTADINGSMSYGSYMRGNVINVNGATARVTRNGNGITTSRTDNGETITYSRSGWSGEWNNRGWNSGNSNSGGSWRNDGSSAGIYGLEGMSRYEGSVEMVRRGFRQVNVSRAGNTSYVIYWRSRSSQCVQATIAGDRFDSVEDIGSHPKCR